MSRKERVRYSLDTGDIKQLSENEIRMILRAADELISIGGRSMLVKILKGSKDKKVLEHKLDKCPAYGFYHSLTMQEISYRVDWMIKQDYIRIDYNWKLPVVIFSEKGWMIEEETFAEEIYQRFCLDLRDGRQDIISEMKDVNRQVVFDVLEKIRISKNPAFIPMLEAWKAVEVRKIRERISKVVRALDNTSEEPEMRFRRARKDDWGEVMNLIHKAVQKGYPQEAADFYCMYYSRQRIQADIQAGERWVLLSDGRIIGTGSLIKNHISEVYVLPEVQNKGYETRIIREMEKQIAASEWRQ